MTGQPERMVLGGVWDLVECLQERERFSTACGLEGRSVLDYPPGLQFSVPLGITEAAGGVFREVSPGYVVWSRSGLRGGAYTVAYWSALALPSREGMGQHWAWPELVGGRAGGGAAASVACAGADRAAAAGDEEGGGSVTGV